ncbi:alpha/beta hydrolase fold domain-containing protein [Pelagovum pacificum]|uniref:Alpha/beta hydrolase n=1 Tax=Pelagovum pacificum TaxID=2588711 RepID=A0A5C5GDH1_9RHOB|nr:alpha/beta hydrolase fold domain-containing protein [Pelagovum pacificum]QQA44676.1 alpha/beta hydrolase fold domain-containing protein [Pelagovum pacificum]TNY32214.1 alpha/beta hydrolase [Pelagovum pacificum]
MTSSVDPAYQAASAPYATPELPFTADGIAGMRRERDRVLVDLAGWHADKVEITRDSHGAVHRPEEPKGWTLYLHGGGWVLGSSTTHGAIMTDLAATSGTVVVGPDYPLAPESPYPGALDMLETLVRERTSAEPGPWAVAGDSAGANLALGLALRLRDDKGPMPAALGLFYGCFRREFDTDSHRELGDGTFGLTTAKMRDYWSLYVGETDGSPYGDLSGMDASGLPPTIIRDAALDPLRDDGAWLDALLRKADVPVDRAVIPGVPHGFAHYTGLYTPAHQTVSEVGRFLRTTLDA